MSFWLIGARKSGSFAPELKSLVVAGAMEDLDGVGEELGEGVE
jgi:hypothetical protein